MRYIHQRGKLALLASSMVAVGCIAPFQPLAEAQSSVAGWPSTNYTPLPSKVVPFPTKATVLKEGTFSNPTDEQTFTDYYNKQLFPNITNPANRQSQRDDVITRLRIDLRPCEKAQSQDVFNKLVDLTLAYMTKVAEDGQFHPVARVNAMQAIGEINSPKAAKVLLDTAFKRGELFPIRIAAMAGLIRMAGSINGKAVLSDPDFEPKLFKSMVGLVKFHAKKDNSADGVEWMRGQAADLLAELGSTGAQGQVPPALLTMLNDKDMPIQLRSKAAWALGKLNYSAGAPAPGPYLTALAGLADDAFASDQPTDRGRVKLVIRDVQEALKKLAPLSTGSNDQPVFDGLQKAMQAIGKETEEKMAPDDLRSSMNKAKASLDGFSKG